MKKIFALLIVFQIIFSKDFFAQRPGDLDSTFGVNGIVVTEFEGYDIRVNRDKPDGIKAVFPMDDGKILCVGTADKGKHFIAARYDEDGSIDETYGVDGFVIVEDLGFVSDAKMTENGKLIIVGYDSNDIVLLKLKYDGTIDSTFGESGRVFTSVGTSTTDTTIQAKAYCISIQNDNKILVGGTVIFLIEEFLMYSSNRLAIRYLDDGTIDSSFADNGILITQSEYFPSIEEVYDIYSFPDNSLFLIGHIQYTQTIIKLKENGEIDSTFSEEGNKHFFYTIDGGTAYGTIYKGSKVVDNKIVFVGNSYLPFPFYTPSKITLSKMKLDGELDSLFGIGGKNIFLEIDTNYFDHFHMSIEIMEDSKIISAGFKDYTNKNFHIIRYHENGMIDSTFGTNGIVKTFIGNSCMALCSALQDDGKLLVAGVSDSGAFTIARYHAHSDTPTSILPLEKYNTLLLYPNPVSDILFIDKIHEPILQIDIRNILGREMHLPINDKSIDVSSLPSGLYFIKTTTDKGEFFGKFVKE